MKLINRYMFVLTALSVLTALVSIVWQAFLVLKQLNNVTTILVGLLAIESGLDRSQNDGTPIPRPKVAIGYGACTDLLISATTFLNFTEVYGQKIGPKITIGDVNEKIELLRTFAYYFKNGAAAERVMPNKSLFQELINTAKTRHRDNIQWAIGGNAPLMGIRFHTEGATVLLGARISSKLRRLIPAEISIAGEEITEDDIHLILEYKAGEEWGPLKAPRANRYILHNDQNNPHLNSLEQFDEALKEFQPQLLVISGLQMMDSYKFETGIREARLAKVREQMKSQPPTTMQHFEMASYVELKLLQLLRREVLPYVDSLGMNEQELDNLWQVLEYGRITLASDSNPRVAITLDHMRRVFELLADDYAHSNGKNGQRLLTRIHLHTLAYQALFTVKNSPWRHSRVAAAKAALTAHRYVCQTNLVNPESAFLVLDDSFATSASGSDQRINFKPREPVACWTETLVLKSGQSYVIEICVAPVLVCRVAKKTAGAGDNISAAALSQQL